MTDEQMPLGDERPAQDALESDTPTVLELFGIEIKVRNPRLAEILTMDAGEALGTEIAWPHDADTVRGQRAELREAAPESAISVGTPKEAHEIQERAELRHRVDALGLGLGFEVSPNGVWSSSTGFSIVVRALSGTSTFAAASDVVHKLEARRSASTGPDESVLFVTQHQETVDVLKVAIRQANLHDHIRTVSVANLESARRLQGVGVLDHQSILALLIPVFGIDAGDLLSLCRDGANPLE